MVKEKDTKEKPATKKTSKEEKSKQAKASSEKNAKDQEAKAPTEETPEKTGKVEEPEVTDTKDQVVEVEVETNSEKFEFQSEVKQLLHILVYSLYQHKEVFVRELISNSADALNKVQFESLLNSDIEDKDLDLRIDITMDKDKRKFIIEDTGIGMTKEDLIENLGTIAHSGTVEFLKRLTETENGDKMNMIGQFGVGFYSSFMAADEIHVHTKSYKKGSKGYLWKSKGDNNYSIEEKGKKQRGTRIELFLKEDEKEFLEKYRIKSIIGTHSKFVPFPIYLEQEKIDSKEAIWTQPKSQLKEKDYNEFFRFFQNATDDPETYIHLSSDAPVQFNAVMYVPKVNSEIYGWVKSDPGLDLYSRKVLIQKSCRDILPEYFRFIKGVVDSEDIPLNISRETIQSNIRIDKIRKFILKKIFDHLNDVKSKDFDKYLNIWKNFQRNFKEGVPNEYEYREQLAQLLLFYSSKTQKDKYTDLDQYIGRMPSDQYEIFYVMGTNHEAIEKNPALEAFKKKDLEVLYFLDPMDAWAVDHLQQYKGKMFRPVEMADIKLEDEEAEKKEKEEKNKEELKDAENFVTYLKTTYGPKIEDVKISQRLVDSPCMLVTSKSGPSPQLERIMRLQNQKADFSKKILEINPKNKLIQEMIRIYKLNPVAQELKTLAFQLLDNMILREGVLEEIEHIVPRIHDIMFDAAKNFQYTK